MTSTYRDHTRQVNYEIKDNILNTLDAVEACGSYAAIGEFNGLTLGPKHEVPFDIHIRKTDGVIQYPLDREGIKNIASQARKAPYGKGSQTIVDQKNFEKWWTSLLAKVAESLGVDASNMDLHLYKMLLYPPGGMFKAHTDSEKEPGMFGTLVLSLPSHHKGGDVVLRHAGHKMTYSSSAHRFTWAAWYSDVRHEAAIHKALATWLSVPGSPRWPYLLYELDHDYTVASVKFNTLKGRDKVRAQILDKLGKKELKGEYKLFIALLELEEHGDCYFDYDHEVGSKSRYGYRAPKPAPDWHEFRDIERSERTMTVMDLDGEELDNNLEFDSDNILQKTPFSKGTKEETGYTGYMGNYGPEATHWYRTTMSIFPSALIIYQRTYVDDLLPEWEGEEEEEGDGSEESEGQEESQVDNAVEVPPPRAVRRPLAVRRAAVPVAGGKRKIVELIDLTGDSD